jgi:hypothetical protein
MKQTEGLGNGGDVSCHITHMDMLQHSLLPTLAISLPGMKYGLAARTTPTVTAETMPGASYATDDINMKTWIDFILGDSPASAVWNTVSVPHSQVSRYKVIHTYSSMNMDQKSVPKCWQPSHLLAYEDGQSVPKCRNSNNRRR